jgi:hypothetical protein
MTVDRVDLATFELRQAATALELEDASRALDLVQMTGERVVRQRAEVVPTQLVERRSQHAHVREDIEQVFEAL